MTYGIRWTGPIALASLVIGACDAKEVPADQPSSVAVAETAPVTPQADQVAAEVTRLLAGIKWESSCPNDTTCVYVQTFFGEATREITLSVSPNRKYNRTFAEKVNRTAGNSIYDFKYAADFDAEPVTINLNFYVGREGLPTPAKTASHSPFVRFASQQVVAFQAPDGAGIMWSEVGKKGADVAIGAIVDAAKDKGVKGMGPLGTIYSLASMIGDAGGAMGLAKQNSDWQAELDALEKCAANPTNTVSRSDPNYSSGTVAKIQAARKELREVNSVRFLNQMAEKTADFSVVTTIMSVGLKQGYAWSEQTLDNYSENTIMREARLAVVLCTEPEDAKGNLTYTREDIGFGSPQVKIVTTVVANVTWAWKGGALYLPRGTYRFQRVKQIGPCIETGTGQGNLEGTGDMAVFNDAALQRERGYGYEARFVNLPTKVTTTRPCAHVSLRNYTLPEDINYIPQMRGYQGTGGNIEGSFTRPLGGGGKETMTWSFAVPPAK